MTEDFKIPTMLTIEETARRTGVAPYFVRQCCLKNQIAYVKAGRKYLVNFEKFVDYLNGK